MVKPCSGNGQTALLLAESRLLFVLIALHVGQQTARSPLYILEVIAKACRSQPRIDTSTVILLSLALLGLSP